MGRRGGGDKRSNDGMNEDEYRINKQLLKEISAKKKEKLGSQMGVNENGERLFSAAFTVNT